MTTSHNWHQILVLLIIQPKKSHIKPTKINKRLVGRMWVAVPWERDLWDIDIVKASPYRGSATAPSQSLLCSQYLAAIDVLVWL